ncbi:MAG: hypothetical protein ACFFDB_00245 [Promethearchaeota archaeon]
MDMYINLIGIFLLPWPALYVMLHSSDELKSKRSLYLFIKGYLISIISFFAVITALSLYLKIFKTPITAPINVTYLFTAIFLLFKLEVEDIDKNTYFFMLILYLFVILYSFYYISYIPLEPDREAISPLSSGTRFGVLIAIILISIIPIAITVLGQIYVKKRLQKIDFEIKTEDLKYISYYLSIAVICFLIFTLVTFFISFGSTLFSGATANDTFFDEDVGDVLNEVFRSVWYDPLFGFTVAFTLLGALARSLDQTPYILFGNIAMLFMPMVMWITVWFGDPPRAIVTLFFGFELFAKIFHILIVTIMLVIVLSTWRLFLAINSLRR